MSARADGLEASVSTQATALADVQGNLAASLTLRARAGGATGEIEVVAADDPTGPPLSSVVIRSDRFRFEGDLAEFLGTVRITSAVIDDLTVQRSNIAPGIVTSFDFIQNPVDWNGGSAQAENGMDALIGTQDVTFSSDANACPEKIVARPRLTGLAPYVNTGNGTLAIYFRIVIKRTRGGVVTTLRDYIEPYWQFVKASGAITKLYYAGRPPSAVVAITQPSFLPGDTLTFEYYYNRTLAGAIGGSVALTSYDLEVEEYYR